jgi:hypothetical protein
LSTGTEQSHEKPRVPRLETGTSQLRSKSAYVSAATYVCDYVDVYAKKLQFLEILGFFYFILFLFFYFFGVNLHETKTVVNRGLIEFNSETTSLHALYFPLVKDVF